MIYIHIFMVKFNVLSFVPSGSKSIQVSNVDGYSGCLIKTYTPYASIISPSALQQLHTDVSTMCPLAAFALEIFLIAIGIFPCAPRGHLSFAFCRFGISGCGCGFVWVAKLYHSSWSAPELYEVAAVAVAVAVAALQHQLRDSCPAGIEFN